MTISRNPTRTKTIESNWSREINRRWAAFKSSVTDQLIQLNKINGILANKGAVFDISASQLRIYMQFLQNEIAQLLLVTDSAPNWQANYQAQAYQKGLDNTRQKLIAQGGALVLTPEEQLAALE